MNKIFANKEAVLMGRQYLKHEFRKIFSDVKNDTFWKKLDRSIDRFVNRKGEQSFFNLLVGISEGWKLKEVAQIISNNTYSWKKTLVPMKDIILTGMSPTIDKYTIVKCKRSPQLFANEWENNTKMRKEILSTGFKMHKNRDKDPIFLFQEGKKYKVFDGMRRTLLAAIRANKKIYAWVGSTKNKKGKPLTGSDNCLFLALLYARSNKNQKIENGIMAVSKEIIKQYRNGEEVFRKRIAKWSHNKDIRKLFLNI